MLALGQFAAISGNVTTLNWIGARPAEQVEQNLGFGAGRLRNGYWILVLKEALREDDFQFDGTTLRSGGRDGLPAKNEAQDALRTRVHAGMIKQYGEAQYRTMQRTALAGVQIIGAQRIVKMIADTPHNPLLTPDIQYPAGGGGLQWKILDERKKRFLAALHVDNAGMAKAPGFSISIATGAPYENRHQVHHWLASA